MVQKATHRQRIAIRELVAGATVTDAARVAGVLRQTVHRWMADDERFRAAMSDAEAEALNAFQRGLVRLGDKAIVALEAVFDDSDASHAEKLRAVGLIAMHAPKLREFVDLEERMARIEAQLGVDR